MRIVEIVVVVMYNGWIVIAHLLEKFMTALEHVEMQVQQLTPVSLQE